MRKVGVRIMIGIIGVLSLTLLLGFVSEPDGFTTPEMEAPAKPAMGGGTHKHTHYAPPPSSTWRGHDHTHSKRPDYFSQKLMERKRHTHRHFHSGGGTPEGDAPPGSTVPGNNDPPDPE